MKVLRRNEILERKRVNKEEKGSENWTFGYWEKEVKNTTIMI